VNIESKLDKKKCIFVLFIQQICLCSLFDILCNLKDVNITNTGGQTNNMIKSIARLLSILLVITILTGCASNNNGAEAGKGTENTPTPTAPDETEKPKDPIKLTMWGGVPPEAGPQAVVDSWNAENPNVQVEYVRFVNDDDGNLKLDTALATGQDADLFVNYTTATVEKRIKAGVTLDLSQFTEYNIDEKMGVDAADWKTDGKYYAMPTKANKFFVWLNKDALDELGLPVPFDWTWEDMAMYSEKLTKQGSYGLVQHLAAFPDPWDSSVIAEGYVKADGTSNLDNAYARTWLETIKEMMDKGTTPPMGEQLTSKMPVDTMFLKGEAGMLNAGEWIFRSSNNMKDNPRSFKIAFAPAPKVSADQSDFKFHGGLGDAISINAKSAYTKEAWEFLKWYADGGMAPLAAGGRLPASKDANMDAAIESLLGDQADSYDQESLKKVVFGQFDTYSLNMPTQAIDLRKEEYEKYFLNAQSLEDTIKKTVERHNEFLK